MRTVPAPGDKIIEPEDEDEEEEEETGSKPKRLKSSDDKFVSIGVLTTTPTTPTLTPTRIQNIEEDFFHASLVQPPSAHQNQAKFVPPLVRVIAPSAAAAETSFKLAKVKPKETSSSSAKTPNPKQTKKMPAQNKRANAGGSKRKSASGPAKTETEEDIRRRLRRERNKAAAARCRKRRLDQTVSLTMETEELEEKRRALQNEVFALQGQKNELERILGDHVCCMKDRKLPVRPTSLPLKMALTASASSSAPVPMDLATSTPSKGLNLFDSPNWPVLTPSSLGIAVDTIDTPVVDSLS